jgi:16S rRNA (uracil1498-N3)-methyltransferase
MKEHRTPRLYVTEPLSAGAAVVLTPGQAHHLWTVLRLRPGAVVKSFNPTDGEWLCRLGGRDVLAVETRIRPVADETDLWLLFAPVKRARVDWLVERATELGAAALIPVWTRHTRIERLNLDRLRAHAVAAAEQSERLSVPQLHVPRPLAVALAQWPEGRRLFFCDETGGGEPVATAMARHSDGPFACLVGPEGGFDVAELDHLGKLNFVTRVGLGPRVLRADTAAVAVLAVLQAVAGDWRRTRFD